MYRIGLLSLITAVLSQSTTTLIPVKPGYFDITPSTTQVTLTLQSGGISDSINLNDGEHILSDFSSEEKSIPSQQLLELFSTDKLQFPPFHALVSDITFNACLISLASNEKHAANAVDYDSAVKKVGAMAGLIVADMVTVSGENPQTILHLYNAAKLGTSFNTAQLSLPGSGGGSDSQVTIQINLSGYPFKLGIPLRTESPTKKAQCLDISKLATIHALNLITSSAIQALQQNVAKSSSFQLNSNTNPSISTTSNLSMFSKELADKASNLGFSDIVEEALSNSETAEKMGSQSLPPPSSSFSFDTVTQKNSPAKISDLFNSNVEIIPSNPNTMGTSINYDKAQPLIQQNSVEKTEPPNIQTDSSITNQSTFISTDNSANIDAATGAIVRSGPTSNTDVNSNNSGTIPNISAIVENVSSTEPILPFIPRLEGRPDIQSQNYGQLNSIPRTFQTNSIRANIIGNA
ncbi:hypothetical protein K501DRAFT_280828 [Backusella circina FSU 941]|nr:hypothetical protein K501DRAFT_280828 [Backusella circina FSU 941]